MSDQLDPIKGPGSPDIPEDAGSQALAEALRSSFAIVKLVMVALVVVFLCSGFFTVGPQERAIILHLGRPAGTGEGVLLGPGLHWSWPYPIDEYVKVSITGLQKVNSTVGWYATTPEMELANAEPMAGPSLNPAIDGYAVSGDGNIIHTRANVTYRISDPVRYVFNFVNASNSMQSVMDNALLLTASRFRVDDILTRNVLEFREAVRRRAVELVEQRQLGVTIEQCSVQSIPPRQIKAAFDDVLKAEVKRDQVLTEAHGYENQVSSKASADAQTRISLAQSDRARLINEVSSRSEQFKELLPKYDANPSLFVEQRLTEVLGRTLTNFTDKFFVTEGEPGNAKELRLLINKEPVKLKTEETKP
jgi:membrane protease subunit HflK